jgi:uncharacterized membrane protein
LVFGLPIVITVLIVYWLLVTLKQFVLDPAAKLINYLHAQIRHYPMLEDLPNWWIYVASPVLAILLALAVVYVLGLVFRSWVYRMIDWLMLHVPVVATIYRAVRNVIDSLGNQFQGGPSFKRVVLVEFPHPGMRSLGLVTNTLRDATTDQTILTVCVLSGILPPTGFTLFVPEASVTNVAWSVNDTLQAILSGGITTPPTIHYVHGLSTPSSPSGGAIVDAHGHVVRTLEAGPAESGH